uniref:Uncharacterized protein n=1 Tax=Sinocyclocheilus rhinocerous TaxID=307959 RepID=A0A673LSI1_9TELE
MLPPYYIPGMPTMVPIAPPSLIDPNLSTAPSLENSGSACSMSELSSLHDVETDFRQTYRQVQKKALPAIPDLDDPADLRATDLSPVHEGRYTRQPQHRNRVVDERPRWNPRSEHLQRKAFLERGRTGSVDELEEFAMAYMQRGRHGDVGNREDDYRERERDRYPFYCSKASPARRPPSPPPLPGNKRDTWDNGQAQRDPRERDQSARDRRPDYDHALLNSLFERKAKAVKSSASKAGQTEDDSDTPSKNSSKKSSERFHSRTPSNQSPRQRTAEDNESLPPYTAKELERSRGAESGQQPFRYTRSGPGPEEQNRPRKVSTLLSRDSLVV